MGSAPSREIRARARYPATTTRYDWDAEEGGYIPYRFQGAHRQKWRNDDRLAFERKARLEKERSVRRYDHVTEKKREFRSGYDKRRRGLDGGRGKVSEVVRTEVRGKVHSSR